MTIFRSLCVLLLFPPTWSWAGDSIYRGLPNGPAAIEEDRQGRVYVAVFGEEGLVVRIDDRGARPWKRGRIESLRIAPDGAAWLVEGGRITRYGGESDGRDRSVDRTASFRPKTVPGKLFASRWGDLWSANCRAMRRPDHLFVPALLDQGDGWTITPACDDPFGNVWALATGPDEKRHDLAVWKRDRSSRWERIGLPEGEVAGRPIGPCVDDVGFVWLASETALLRVDPRSAAPGLRVVASPVAAPITAIAPVANRQIVVGFSDGSVRELNVEADMPPRWETVETLGSGPIRSLLHDRRGNLWAVGGEDLYRVESLRAQWQRDWDEQPRMPAGNHDNIFARIGNKLYTAGGKTYFGYPAAQWVNLDHVWSYDIGRGDWRIEPPMLEPGKAYSGIAALDGELWLIGGLFRGGPKGTTATGSVEIYDPRSRRYRWGPPLDEPRGQVVALTVDDRLYAIGGASDERASSEVVSIAAGETDWKPEPPAPGPIVQASGCVIGGKFYIAAGPASKCPGLFIYDPRQRVWDQVEHPADTPPSAPLCAALDGEVWVMGGTGAGGGRLTSYVYSPLTRRWHKGPDLPLPVSWGAAADVDGRLLIAGGAYRASRVGNYFNSDRVFLLRRER